MAKTPKYVTFKDFEAKHIVISGKKLKNYDRSDKI